MKMITWKKHFGILILVVVFSISIAQIPVAHSVELSTSDKAMSFLTDVAKIDVTKYNITVSNVTLSSPSDIGGLTKAEGGFILESTGQEIHVSYVYVNDVLNYFNVNPR